MENIPVANILLHLDDIHINSPLNNDIQLEKSKLYFSTSKNHQLEIVQITEEIVNMNRKPYYPKQFIGYYKFTCNSLDVSGFSDLFRRAKLDGIDIFIFKYNGKFLEDTDVIMSALHPFLLIEFYQKLEYKAMADLNGMEAIPPNTDPQLLVKLLSSIEYMVNIRCGHVKLMDTVSIGLTINQRVDDEDDDIGLSISLFQTFFSIDVIKNTDVYPILDAWVAEHNLQFKIQDDQSRSLINYQNITDEPFILGVIELATRIGEKIPDMCWNLIYTKTIELF